MLGLVFRYLDAQSMRRVLFVELLMVPLKIDECLKFITSKITDISKQSSERGEKIATTYIAFNIFILDFTGLVMNSTICWPKWSRYRKEQDDLIALVGRR